MRVAIAALAVVSVLVAPAHAGAQVDTVRPRAGSQATDPIFGTINLPQTVMTARREGVVDATITAVLDRLRRTAVPAADAEEILVQEVEVVRAGGPVGNFGAFVQAQLDRGLRGRALADAIRAEHRRRGIGIPEGRPTRDRTQLARPVRPGGGPTGAAPPRGGPRDGAPTTPADTTRGRSGGRAGGGPR